MGGPTRRGLFRGSERTAGRANPPPYARPTAGKASKSAPPPKEPTRASSRKSRTSEPAEHTADSASRPPSRDLVPPSRDRQRNLTRSEKEQLLIEYGRLPIDKQTGFKIGVAALEAKYGRARGYITRNLLNKLSDDSPLKPKERADAGKPKILTPSKDQMVKEQGKVWGQTWSWDDMAAHLRENGVNVTGDGLRKHCLSLGWDPYARMRALSYLKPHQMEDRVDYAAEVLEQRQVHGRLYVHVDEKWFYTELINQLVKVPPGEEAPVAYFKSKSQIPKVMFLCALGEPQFDGGKPLFDDDGNCTNCTDDGKIALVRIAEMKLCERGDYRTGKVTGQYYPKDVKEDAKFYQKVMKEQVFPAIRQKYSGYQGTIWVQQDGALPHTGKQTVQILNDLGAQSSPKIQMVTQAAQSPDHNVCDLAFFRALSKLVRKLRAGKRSFDVEKLVLDVEEAWDDYKPETLAKMWDHLDYCLWETWLSNGGNSYRRHKGPMGAEDGSDDDDE